MPHSPRRRWLPRVVLVGVALTTLIIAALVALGGYRGPPGSSPSNPIRLGGEALAANAGPAGDSGPSSFAFLDKPRPLPEVRFVDDAGRSLSLAEFHGRPLVLNIWATWCVPCRKEMPTLDRLQATLRNSDALVVPLSIDSKGVPAVESFYKEIGITSLGIYVNQSGDATRLLGAVGIPTTLLVDRRGREIGRKIGPAEWDSPEMVALIRSHLKPQPVGTDDDQRQ